MRPGPPAWRAGLLAALATAALSACIIVPVPERKGTLEGRRGNIGEAMPAFIVEGRTTRQEVLLTLGEPDRRDEQDLRFVYDSARRLGGVTWVVLVGGYASSGGFVLGTQQTIAWRELILRFDAAGVLSKAEYTVQQERGFTFGDRPPAPQPPSGRQPSPAVLAYRDALQAFVPAAPGERVREGFVSAACRVQESWQEALAFVTDRAVYCWRAAPSGGAPPTILLHWTADAIVAADWAPGGAASDPPAVQLRHRDGASALFVFHPIEGPATDFDRVRAARFLDAVRMLSGAAVPR